MRWINLDCRLPQNEEDILIINEHDIQIVVCYTEGRFYHNGTEPTTKITHWMPLPKPPKNRLHGNKAMRGVTKPRKLTKSDLTNIYKEFDGGAKPCDLAKKYGVTTPAIMFHTGKPYGIRMMSLEKMKG